ncbi:hypothetical protein CERSUDRAFT_93268 [Gelatoporia subvermispora B]|uniref:Fork-head domain-containing protein n=1 Tax=Ceriporiopsis subvermispora (strain B) TaxID=914234 RepID=M2R3V1_CERS8|nr:hypothetical protein CERSUDRAFT_93268 [Gelatoporia subvermispora B]
MAEAYAGRNPTSPISQLLRSLGMTREDLSRHSEQMRQFLTTETAKSSPPFSSKPERKDAKSLESRPRIRSRTSSLINASATAQSPTPPVTPVKAEPTETLLPSRSMDQMHLVMERKSKNKQRDRRNSNAPSRDARRVHASSGATPSRSETPQTTPQTPHHFRYYRERVLGEASTSQVPLDNSVGSAGALSATPSRDQSRSRTSLRRTESHFSEPRTPSRPGYVLPTTPRASSPCSSPPRIVNIVSSPGPMRSDPLEEDYDDLPFTLPPGPYSSVKPDFSYAAMIGQAIVSSPQHRLTLQDIYEWITTVYPYYKRGEQTWMNSVRHALSTMAVFRKVPRGRQEGKSLWAVFDEDLPCFANGGFRKALCADMNKAASGKSGSRKRGVMEDTLTKKTKRRKKAKEEEEAHYTIGPALPMMAAPMLPPFFPPYHPNPHHQPYYQAYVPQPLPAEVIFPPLPPSSNYHRVATMSAPPASEDRAVESGSQETVLSAYGSESVPSVPDNEIARSLTSSSSLPELLAECSSTSSPPPTAMSSRVTRTPSPVPHTEESTGFIDEDDAFQWLRSPAVEALDPSFTLLDSSHQAPPLFSKKAGKQPDRTLHQVCSTISNFLEDHSLTKLLKLVAALQEPASPTLDRVSSTNKHRSSLMTPPPSEAMLPPMPFTPPARPSTPPAQVGTSRSNLRLSPHRTPISHRGLHMSPSPSLAHYKSHLDPPPAAYVPQAPLLSVPAGATTSAALAPGSPGASLFKTPTRKRTSGSVFGSGGLLNLGPSPFAPVTPRRLMFGASFESPFRTPSRGICDPHDPSVLLDEELARLGQSPHLLGSPTGIFGRSRGLLYESPGMPSPGSWDRVW